MMKRKNRKILVILSLFCIVTVYYVMQISNNASLEKVLIVGTAGGYAPFVSMNEHGDYEGFDIDVANALAQKMDKKLVIKDCGSMTTLFIALEQGRIDVIIWGLSIIQDRLNKVEMIRYQGTDTISYPLLFWKSIPLGINSIDDMYGKKVCVEPSSSQDVVLSKYPLITKISTEKVDDALLSLQYKKVDAILVEPAIAQKFKRKYPEIQILEVPLAVEDQVQGIGIAIKKGNKELIDTIAKLIRILREEGAIRELETKWGIA